jgi:hypothetical protein
MEATQTFELRREIDILKRNAEETAASKNMAEGMNVCVCVSVCVLVLVGVCVCVSAFHTNN